MDLIDKLKRVEGELNGLKEDREDMKRKTEDEISKLETEIKGLEGTKKAVQKEEFLSQDQSGLKKQLEHFDGEISKRRKEIKSIRSSSEGKIEDLDQKIGNLESAYVAEVKEVLPILFSDVCLTYKRKWGEERLICDALAEVIDKFLKIKEEATQARSRYANVLSRFKTLENVPEAGIKKMEGKLKERYELQGDPLNSSIFWVVDRIMEVRKILLETQRTLGR